MIDNIQIVLFFDKFTSYNPTQIAAGINKLAPFIGNAIILPVNPEEPDAPIIIFNESKDINLTVTRISTAIIFKENDLKKYKETVIDIVNFYDSEGISFKRIGIVITRILPKTAIKKLKKAIFKDEEIIESTDFAVAWHNIISLDSTKFNCWERYFMEAGTEHLVGVFDINTPHDEKYNIKDDFVDKCIAKSIKYVDEKIKK